MGEAFELSRVVVADILLDKIVAAEVRASNASLRIVGTVGMEE